MKFELSSFWILTILILFISCKNKSGATNTNDCKNAIVDEQMVALSNYNSTFYDKNYTGSVISYFDENETKEEYIIYYENGKIFKYESFYENGDPKMIKPIKCNAIHGNLIFYVDSNRLGYEMEYKLGKMDGTGKSYYDNGNIYKLVRFKDDKRHGEQYTFSETGDTIQIEIYDNGVKIN